jgi:hypothetical protein
MRAESHPGSLTGMADDQLATTAVSLVVGELQWTPDVSPVVMDRISRDAVAYPEQFDRRPPAPAPPASSVVASRSAKRTVGRLAVFGVVLVIIVALALISATVNAAAANLDAIEADLVEVASGYDEPIALEPATDGSDTIWSANAAELISGSAVPVPIGAIDGTLVSFGADVAGELYAIEEEGRILHVATETS